MLALLATALTSSTALGITTFVVYYLIETTASPILSNFDWFQRISEYLLSPNVTTVLQASYGEVSISINGSSDAAPAGHPPRRSRPRGLHGHLRRVDVYAVPTTRHHRRKGQLSNSQIIIAVKTAGPASLAPVAQVCNPAPAVVWLVPAGSETDPRLFTPAHYCRQGPLSLRDRSLPES